MSRISASLLRIVRRPAAFVLASLLAVPVAGQAPTVFEEAKIVPGTTRRNTFFGQDVAVFGDFAAIGAPGSPVNGDRSGAVYVLRRDGASWVEETIIDEPQGAEDHQFGFAVDVAEGLLVAGSPGNAAVNGPRSGGAWIFRLDADSGAWVFESALIDREGSAEDRFGWDVAIDGDVAAVAAPFDDEIDENAGAVHVFRFDGAAWNLETVLSPADLGLNDRFGISIAVDGDVLAVGAYTDVGSVDAGGVYLYRYDGAGAWSLDLFLPAPDPDRNGLFGSSVDLESGVLLVGEEAADAGADSAGVAWVFRESGPGDWLFEQRLAQVLPGFNHLFGGSTTVAEDGTALLVGAPGDDGARGAVHYYEFDAGTWEERAALRASDADVTDLFGEAAGIAPDRRVLAGSDRDSDELTFRGAVYDFDPTAVVPFTLEEPEPGECGTTNTFRVVGATPGAEISYVYGFQSGGTSVPGCPGSVRIEIRRARLVGSAIADDEGVATFEIFVSNAAADQQILLQALDPDACLLTNVVTTIFVCE